MIQQVQLDSKSLEDYSAIIGEPRVQEILDLAETLKGARVVHINSTAFGGGVAEILQPLVPLMRDVGLNADWQVIEAQDEFWNVTKASHNGLQGMELEFSEEMKDIWRRYNLKFAESFEGEYDFVVVHDPQPAGLLHFHGREGGKHWLWRCHIDTSDPNPDYWNFYVPFINEYDCAIFTMEQYVGPGVEFEQVEIIPPKIDPLSPKNVPIPEIQAKAEVARFGIDLQRPLVTQVSRFDPWKDPIGVIDAYRMVKKEFPTVQLALVGSMATDDPEGWTFLDRTIRRAGEDEDIFVLHNFHGVGAYEVGCFQTVSDIIVQKSTKEGFGLVVTEALWKGKPVIGGNVGGIPLQIIDGKTGYLVETVDGCASRIMDLLQAPEKCKKMGEAGRAHVKEHFLITRHLKDYLQVFSKLA